MSNTPPYSPATSGLEVRFASLETEVGGIKSGLSGLAAQLSNLTTTINDRGRTPWNQIWAAGGVCVAILSLIGTLVYSPISQGLTRADRDIQTVRVEAVSVQSFLDFKNTYENQRITSRNDNDAKFVGVKSDITNVNNAIAGLVSRSEIERAWTGNDKRLERIENKLDDLETRRTVPVPTLR